MSQIVLESPSVYSLFAYSLYRMPYKDIVERYMYWHGHLRNI